MIPVLAAVAVLAAAAALSAALARAPRAAGAVVAAALLGAAALAAPPALRALGGAGPADLARAWSLPGASLHVGLDALSAAFLLLVLLVCACAGIYGESYLSSPHGHVPALPARFFFLTLAGAMVLLLCARGAVLFMAAWETMALAAFGLVSCEHDRPEVRRAGLVYLLCAHTGSLLLLALFALLGRAAGSLDFAAFASAGLKSSARGALFALAVAGFGLKAGVLPLHVWLQEAHPAAPSHASAAMSGVMIEMGLYGLLRLHALIGPLPAGAGAGLAALGLATALFGVLFACVQRDAKRLLAYSSIENVGLIVAALGLGAFGAASGRPALAALGFAAAVLHTLNHGLFKSLLFLAAGSVYRASGTRDLEALGGLQKRMPWTAAFMAVGAAAICGLPPLNGFVGEWLLYGWLLRADGGRDVRSTALGAAVLALVGGLAVVAFAKLYGIACLGSARSDGAREARESPAAMLVPMGVLAALCAAVGVFPRPALAAAFAAAASAARLPGAAAPVEEWGRLLGAVGLAGAGVWAVAAVLWAFRARLLSRREVARGPAWGCGFTAPSPRQQYTASSFPAPAARVFAAAIAAETALRPPSGYWPARASFESRAPDPALERWIPALAADLGRRLQFLRRLQHGRLQSYLLYVAVFLVGVLLWKL